MDDASRPEWMHGYVAQAFYAAYERVESQWRLYAKLKEVDNFKETLPDLLRRYARSATLEALDLAATDKTLREGHLAPEGREWMRSAHEALMAAALAAPAEPMDDEERVALAAMLDSRRKQVAALEEALGDAVQAADGLARFLRGLAGEFESAGTTTAARVADRIRRALRDVALNDGEDEEEDDE